MRPQRMNKFRVVFEDGEIQVIETEYNLEELKEKFEERNGMCIDSTEIITSDVERVEEA